MNRNRLITSLITSLALGCVPGAWATPTIDGLISLTPVVEHSVIAVEVQVPTDTAITGLRWFHNDADVVFPNILLVEGAMFQPPVLSETSVVLEDVGGSSLDWSELFLPTPITSSTGVLHVVFELPANVERTGDGLGGGPAIGYHAAPGGPRGYLSTDGENWTRLSRSHSLAVEPMTAMMRGSAGPMTLAASRETVREGWWTHRGPAEDDEQRAQGQGDREALAPVRTSLRTIPNPFNPRTEIAFTVTEAGEVSLDVFDVRGRKVRTLATGTHAVGHYRVVWEGTDASDRPAGSGVYYLRLRTAQGSVTERVVLLR